jgi:hypothetical protein
MISVEVMFDIIDHCAKNATSKTFNIVERNINSSDWSTPQTRVNIMARMISYNTRTILFMILILLERYLNLAPTFLIIL